MHPIIYDVAVSADGFISGPDADVSAFPHAGAIVDDYMARLATYAVALMGRATYEFGYEFGLEPGANPYPHMRAIVVSSTLSLPNDAQVEIWHDLSGLQALCETADGPIYLCGGGKLASAVAATGQLTCLRMKRAPIVLGGGTPLFAGLPSSHILSLVEQRDYGDGLLFQDFRFS